MKTKKVNFKKIKISKLSEENLRYIKGGDGHVLGPGKMTRSLEECDTQIDDY